MVGQIVFLLKINHVKSMNLEHHPTMIKIALKKVSSKDRKFFQENNLFHALPAMNTLYSDGVNGGHIF